MSTANDAGYVAVRTTAALTAMDHVAALRVRGGDAFAAVDKVVSGKLLVRDGQMLHTLVLHESGHPLADLYVCRDDADLLVLAEGLTGLELSEHLSSHLPDGLDVQVDDLRETHDVLSLNGPFAWEVLADWLGPDVVGIPYLTFFHLSRRELGDDGHGGDLPGVIFRAGKTGEFGYDLLLPRERLEQVRDQLAAVGEPLGLGRASLSDLDQCALENGFFDIRRGPFDGLTPIELQLQWRVSYLKAYVGADALARRRARGPERRLATFACDEEVERGEPVFWCDREIGRVWSAGASPIRGDWIGQALIETSLAHPGIDAFVAARGSRTTPIRTLSAPVINNRSLYVDPRRHSARFRDDEGFPPLVLR